MLNELIENAPDFGDEGGVCLWRQPGKVVLQVISCGSPIPTPIQKIIFDPLVSARRPSEERQHLGAKCCAPDSPIPRAKLRALNDIKEGKVIFEVTLPTASVTRDDG